MTFGQTVSGALFWSAVIGSFYIARVMAKEMPRMKWSIEKDNIWNILRSLWRSFLISFITVGFLRQVLTDDESNDVLWVFGLVPLYFFTIWFYSDNNKSYSDKIMEMSESELDDHIKTKIKEEEEKLSNQK